MHNPASLIARDGGANVGESQEYEVETKVLLQAVKRNISRFPEDFMFQLDEKEFANLRSQFVTSSWGGRRHAPYVFTEQGVAMLSSVLRSRRAILVNVEIMRVFVRLRQMLATNRKLAEQQLMVEPRTRGSKPIGFVWNE